MSTPTPGSTAPLRCWSGSPPPLPSGHLQLRQRRTPPETPASHLRKRRAIERSKGDGESPAMLCAARDQQGAEKDPGLFEVREGSSGGSRCAEELSAATYVLACQDLVSEASPSLESPVRGAA